MQTAHFLHMAYTPWARSEEEWNLRDICMLYGLLRMSPGGWSKAALAASTAAGTPADEMEGRKLAAKPILPKHNNAKKRKI